MRRTWMATGLAVVFAIAGVAITMDQANAQQRRPAATKAPAKKAPAKAAPKRKATPPRPAAPTPPAPPPPIVVAPGATTVGAHAASYLGYLEDARAASATLATSSAAITRMTESLVRHGNGDRFALGVVAYGATVAATDDVFVADARRAAAEMGRDAFIQKLRTEYAFVRTLRNADAAQAKALRAIYADAANLDVRAAGFKEAAYTLQRQPWAVARTPDAAQRNAALAALVQPQPDAALSVTWSAAPEGVLTPETTRAREAALLATNRLTTDAQRAAAVPPATVPAWTPADRMLAVAALSAIGAPVDKRADVEFVMRDPRLVSCMNAARLNMRMCNAATRQAYERSFCLAEHPIGETAKCLTRTTRW